MSIALRALGRTGEGLSFARRAVELAPDSPACLLSLAVTLNRLTNSAEALAVAERAVAIDPDYAWGHEVMEIRMTDPIIESLRAALSVRPEDTTLRMAVARRLLESGDLPAAMAEAAEALRHDPGLDEARDFMLPALSAPRPSRAQPSGVPQLSAPATPAGSVSGVEESPAVPSDGF
jgi:tetratricopeptide (TPR) repeat protein